MTAILHGVGVGPGAPDLLTLRAVAVLRGADVLAYPRANDHAASTAWRIARDAAGAGERLPLTFPMVRDPARVRGAWDAAVEAIGARLAAGRRVAFLVEGDPSLYSSFQYVARGVRARWPEVPVEVVPGVSSVTAVAARAGLSLADGCERIAIVPAAYGVADLGRLLAEFDTVVLMKIGDALGAITDAVATAGLADRAVFVARATMADEWIERDLAQVPRAACDCFGMVVVARGDRAGRLGEAA